MRKLILLPLLMVVMFSGTTFAQNRGFGLGVILGEPTGINFKHWTGGKTALVGAAAWAFGRENSFGDANTASDYGILLGMSKRSNNCLRRDRHEYSNQPP